MPDEYGFTSLEEQQKQREEARRNSEEAFAKRVAKEQEDRERLAQIREQLHPTIQPIMEALQRALGPDAIVGSHTPDHPYDQRSWSVSTKINDGHTSVHISVSLPGPDEDAHLKVTTDYPLSAAKGLLALDQKVTELRWALVKATGRPTGLEKYKHPDRSYEGWHGGGEGRD
jgi:hypothetical protein